MSVKGFHHVGILTQDFDTIRRVFGDVLGCEIGEVDPNPDLGIDILWVHVGGVALEFLRPNGDGEAAAVMRSGVTGVHHIGLEVDDVDAALATAREAGIALLDETSKPGASNSRIGFLDPAGVGTTIVEFVQPER